MQLAQIRPPAPGTEVVNGIVTIKGFEYIFNNVVTIILSLAGILLFIMLVSGGFKILTSGSDPKAAEAGKKTLTYAIGGLVLVVLSFLILRFLQEFTGVNITEFRATN